MPPDDSYAQGVREIEQLRERIRHIEDVARSAPPEKSLAAALAAKFKDADAKATARALASWGPFVPNEAMERSLAGRLAHPELYDRQTLAEAVYVEQKRAAAAVKEPTE